MSDQTSSTPLMDVIGPNARNKRNGKVDYPADLINKFLLLCPEREDIADEMRRGSRHAVAMLREIPRTMEPQAVIDWWHNGRDHILSEAYRLKELNQLVIQAGLVISEADGPL